MRALIVVNHLPLGKSISRYLSFIHNTPSDFISLNSLIKQGTQSYINYSYVITETHDNFAKDYGIQFGRMFEAYSIFITYFFTKNYLVSGYTIQDLPNNCFYIPIQLREFLNNLLCKEFIKGASNKLENILFSNPLTSSHH